MAEKTEKMGNNNRHIPVLDAVRGIAILLVLATHIAGSIPIPKNPLGAVIDETARSCWLGVGLFFVLSGFLITGILDETKATETYFKSFYARRFLRIFPLYYGFLFLLFILTIPLHIEWHGRQWVYLLYLQNTGIVKHVSSTPFSPYFNIDHLWSLAVEEQFYCIWPLFVFLIRDRIKLIWFALISIPCSILIRLLMLHFHKTPAMIYVFTPARVGALMLGAALALAFKLGPKVQNKLKLAAFILLPLSITSLILLALPTQGLNWNSRPVTIIGYTIIAIASASLITLSLSALKFSNIINNPFLRWMGKYSYGIYVLHFPIMLFLINRSFAFSPAYLQNNLAWNLFVAILSAIISIGCAVASFELYESKFLKLKKYFRYDLTSTETKENRMAV